MLSSSRPLPQERARRTALRHRDSPRARARPRAPRRPSDLEISGSCARASAKLTPSSRARRAARSTSACAVGFPTWAASAITTDSAMMRPCVIRRLRSIASGRTISRSSRSAVDVAAEAVTRTSSGSTSHSACQPPSPRSCSCGIALSIVATRPGARTAADRTRDGADRVPLVRHAWTSRLRRRPVRWPPGSRSGPGARRPGRSSQRSARDAERARERGQPIAVRVPGHRRHWKVEERAQPRRDVEAVGAERRQRAGGAAELQHSSGLSSADSSAVRRACERVEPAGSLQTERDRRRLLQPRASGHGRARVHGGRARRGGRRRGEGRARRWGRRRAAGGRGRCR